VQTTVKSLHSSVIRPDYCDVKSCYVEMLKTEKSPAPAGMRKEGHLPAGNVVVLCISSYSQTLSRPIIYALFSQFFGGLEWFSSLGLCFEGDD